VIVAHPRTVLALAVAALAAAVVPTAGAKIVPQKSIAGVPLFATAKQVTAKLGKPVSKKTTSGELGTFVEWRYPRVTVVFRKSGPVLALRTSSRLERTLSGVGVGSTETEVRRGVLRVRCETFATFRTCTVGEELPGHRVTAFHLRRGRVQSITLGIVID
jgi:hypothetical protein